MSFILLGILNSQVSGAAGGAYELIESNILTSSASSVTFSSIPQDYKHLQIRTVHKNSSAGNGKTLIRFNSDSGSNYSSHDLYGLPDLSSTPYSSAASSITSMYGVNGDGTNYAVGIHDILDYANTSKNKTMRIFGGAINTTNTYGEIIALRSGAWYNTSAITSITLQNASFDFVSGSRFSLYGIRG